MIPATVPALTSSHDPSTPRAGAHCRERRHKTGRYGRDDRLWGGSGYVGAKAPTPKAGGGGVFLFLARMLSSSPQGGSMSVNKVILVGRVGRDPETRYTSGGQAVGNFSVATDESYKDRNGERQKRTEWHKIVVWGKQAEIAQQYLKKGSLLFLEGRIQSREWQDKEGQKRTSFEIVASNFRMLGGRGDGAAVGAGAGASAGGGARHADDLVGHAAPPDDAFGGSSAPAGPEISDEDIPF